MNNDIRSQPCSACPYRRDVPSGVWAPQEYEKLRPYDNPTPSQPFAGFACHATPEAFCRGWAEVHSNRGGPFQLLALRMAGVHQPIPRCGVAFFEDGNDAADWGQFNAEDPDLEARETMARLIRKYDRLRTLDCTCDYDHNGRTNTDDACPTHGMETTP